jgi:glucose/arabinose dehydrogenase
MANIDEGAVMRVVFALAAILPAAVVAHALEPRIVPVEGGRVQVATYAAGLENPWGMTFLPDGRLLVTERPGRLRIVGRDGSLSPAVAGAPRVAARSQGGLLDIAIGPNFASDRTVTMCFSGEGEGGGLSTHVARGRLVEEGGAARLDEVRTIFRQRPALSRGAHFGCRLVFGRDGMLFVTLGDYFQHMREAQNLGNTIGKVVRIAPDGSIPRDNPFVNRQGADPAIYSYGHRNVQGATLGPDGALWVSEHGARGGDEINRVLPGRNYGWPFVTRARGYDGAVIATESSRPGMEDPVHSWDTDTTLAPSGAAFVTGDLFPAWRGHLLVGGLRSRVLLRLGLDGTRVTSEEWMLEAVGERIRDVRMGPDGAIYLLTDNARGRVLRVTPAQ